MKLQTLFFLACAAALAPSQAAALNLENKDSTPYRVEVFSVEGVPVLDAYVVKPGGRLTNVCNKGCVLQLPNGKSRTFEGHERVSISGGNLVIEE